MRCSIDPESCILNWVYTFHESVLAANQLSESLVEGSARLVGQNRWGSIRQGRRALDRVRGDL